MPNNNPQGANSFNRFAPEPAYGQKTAEGAYRQAAPLAGEQASGSALNTPRRSKRQASRQQRPAQQQPGAVPAPAPPPPASLAFWQQAASYLDPDNLEWLNGVTG